MTMQIVQEISAVVSAADTLTPTISKRRVASPISAANGQTVLLAGPISQERLRGRHGIPFLDRIPEVGRLVSATANSDARKELVVFVRPAVVRGNRDAQPVTEALRTQLMDAGLHRGAAPRSAVIKP
ncbi:hypothetical protein [Methylobacterium sp. ID0610]|uniref:hypothetical protein n=1 Tax=Methylobacterium carpenticola TaxID=3344827 RepID=UPI0036A36B72